MEYSIESGKIYALLRNGELWGTFYTMDDALKALREVSFRDRVIEQIAEELPERAEDFREEAEEFLFGIVGSYRIVDRILDRFLVKELKGAEKRKEWLFAELEYFL